MAASRWQPSARPGSWLGGGGGSALALRDGLEDVLRSREQMLFACLHL